MTAPVEINISNYKEYKVWDEIIDHSPKLNCAAVPIWEQISSFVPPHFTGHLTEIKTGHNVTKTMCHVPFFVVIQYQVYV